MQYKRNPRKFRDFVPSLFHDKPVQRRTNSAFMSETEFNVAYAQLKLSNVKVARGSSAQPSQTYSAVDVIAETGAASTRYIDPSITTPL